MSQELEDQGKVAPKSVREAISQAKSLGKKYVVVEGVVLAFEPDQDKNKSLLENSLKNINRKEPIAEVIYRNNLSVDGHLSAQ